MFITLPTYVLTNYVPRFSVSFSFYCCFFPSISIDDMGATSGGFLVFFFFWIFLACFQMGFYFVTTGWIFEIGLCVNSINQSINHVVTAVDHRVGIDIVTVYTLTSNYILVSLWSPVADMLHGKSL